MEVATEWMSITQFRKFNIREFKSHTKIHTYNGHWTIENWRDREIFPYIGEWKRWKEKHAYDTYTRTIEKKYGEKKNKVKKNIFERLRLYEIK